MSFSLRVPSLAMSLAEEEGNRIDATVALAVGESGRGGLFSR